MSVDRQFMRLFAERYRSGLILVAIASVMLNVLVFAGSAYMLLVYDSVLPSRSVPTLIGLFGMLLLVYAFQTVFEAIRNEALLGIANGVHDDLFEAIVQDKPYNEAERGALSTMTAIMGRQAGYSGRKLEWAETLASEKVFHSPILSLQDAPPVMPDGNGVYPLPIPGKYEPL